ncbi:RasGEF domain-containing protein [Rhizoctonia solani AG-1 IA]|uniref:RasGEF domain-containing protein n=1 Tax=Thanatephorus cucumeris (strain AG1-IA) TaxID=983506 RepID=L8WSQ2_THACA|nr:RasGEF domain-containing protein [Rhizoctonia solani AG-1 IA]
MSRGGNEHALTEVPENNMYEPGLSNCWRATMMTSKDGFFALVIHRYCAQDETQLDVQPGRLVAVRRVEPSGWAGVVDVEGGKGWIPFRYVRPIDDETVGVLEPIAQQLRLGAYRAITTIRATATNHLEGYSSPDSNESDALGDEWANIPKAATRPRDMDSSKMGSNGTPRVSLDEDVPVPTYTPTTSGEKSPGVQFAAASPPTSFVPSRVRAFKLRSRSKSRDGVRSDSESVSRPRRPSVSIRRTRVSMFGSPREPNPVEQIRRLDARPWYLKPVHLPATGEIVLDSDGSVRAGTLEAIVERLTCEAPSRNQEIMLRRDVLFTYEAFTTSQQLFELITDQYSLEPPRELDESQFLDWKENKLRPTQARVLDVLGAWLDLPRLCQDDPDLIPRMREFLQFVTKPESLASEARRHLRTIEQLVSLWMFTPHPGTYRFHMCRSHLRLRDLQRPNVGDADRRNSARSLHFLPHQTAPAPTLNHFRRSTSPRSGFNSPISRAASPILNNDEGLRPSSPLMLSTSMTSLPSAVTKQQKQQGELGSGLGRARSQRHASASYPRSESRQADLAYTALSERSHSSHGHSSHGHSSHGHSSHAHGSKHLPSAVNDIDPTALAHHLTLLESGLYMRIKRKQVLEWHKTSSSTEDSNATVNDLRNFCVTSDRLAGWVKWSVLSLGTSVRRAEAVGTWIRVAEVCTLARRDVTAMPNANALEDLVLLTSPAGGFAQLKIFYSNVKFAVPFIGEWVYHIPYPALTSFVGMYLTPIVHAADQFKDHLPFPVPADRSPRDEDGWATDGGHSEPVTPTQTQARSKSSRMSIGSPSPLSLNAVPPPLKFNSNASPSQSRRLPSEPPTPTLSIAPSSPTTSTLGSQTKLINFAKRHKQAEIIHAMLKFQGHPYTVSSQSEPQGSTSSPYPHPSSPSSSSSSSVTLIASAGGVAWVEEQLSRAAILTLGTDWTYDRSLRLYDDETGGRTSGAVDKENMAARDGISGNLLSNESLRGVQGREG